MFVTDDTGYPQGYTGELEDDMCQRVTCRTCAKATYRGCGQHVEQVLAGVPAAQRCSCPPAPPSERRWRRLFRRS